MPRYALLIEYDGSRFCGFQRQSDPIPTVQKFLEEKIKIFIKQNVTIHVCGRTDTGVHALGQVAHFDSEAVIDPWKLQGCINHFGERAGVSVLKIVEAPPPFHCRFSAKARQYRYLILNRPSPSPLLEGRALHVEKKLDLNVMREGAKKLLGYHNFESFRSRHCQAAHAIRTLDQIDITEQHHFMDDMIVITIRSQSFLHNQVRIMVGTLVYLGLQKRPLSWVDDLLAVCDRTKSGPTASPQGLYFERVFYEQEMFSRM